MAAELASDGGKADAAEPFLEHPERLLRPPGHDDDEAGRIEAELVKAGAVRLTALPRRFFLDDEEDRPVVETGEAGEQRRGEAARGRGSRASSAARISWSAFRRSPPEKQPVDLGDAEREHRPAPARREELPRRSRVGLRTGRRSDGGYANPRHPPAVAGPRFRRCGGRAGQTPPAP